MSNLELLDKISSAAGISGYEDEVSDIVKSEYQKLNLKYYQDGIGSVVGEKCTDENGPKVMIAAHMDEVGFIVKSIDEQGFIRLQPIGSWWSHMLPGQWFKVVNRKGEQFFGLMGSRATHGLPQDLRSKTMDISELYLDMGVENKQQLVDLGIEEGNMVVPMPHFQIMNHTDRVVNKAFDDRVGTYIMIEVAKALENKKHTPLYLANTVQEEPGLRGARTATDCVRPDICFAIDTTLAGDTPLDSNICRLGDGVVLSMIDSNSIAPRKLVAYVEDICKKYDIKHQYAVFNKGGTDSGNIHKTNAGVINMTLSIPIRYMHTNSSMISMEDVENCIILLTKLVEEINDEVFDQVSMK